MILLTKEHPWPDKVDVLVDSALRQKNEMALFHARFRVIFHHDSDRELHFVFRVLQCTNARSFQCRLKAALTESGIDKHLSFRKLIILRNEPFPHGAKTQQMINDTRHNGGLFLPVPPDELTTLFALNELQHSEPSGFDAWLKKQKPCSQLSLFASIFEHASIKTLEENTGDTRQAAPTAQAIFSTPPSAAREAAVTPLSDTASPPYSDASNLDVPDTVFVGNRLIGSTVGEPLTISQQSLQTHTFLVAGSGSGKTVLVRRLIEECALNGIPSIVIDIANDMSRLGDPWPTPPDSWSETDKQKAERYHRNTEVVVWTPGIDAGRPMNIPLLPDLHALANDPDGPDDLKSAINLAHRALAGLLALRSSNRDTLKAAVLNHALTYFSQHHPGDLCAFIDLLSELPPEASDLDNAGKIAAEISNLLKAKLAIDPLLLPGKNVINPAELFGVNSAKTRISVINLSGLSSLEKQLNFVNNLSMHLYIWLKKNPKAMRGLFVFDEAKEFIPSGKSTATKDTLRRFAAQGRKYGVGMVFATQMPRGIDHEITGNCKNHFYGRATSPAAIDTVKQLVQERGGSGTDIGKLDRGIFYAATETVTAPCKIKTPLCLSYHPSTPLTEDEVVQRAKQSR
ncbi:MAG: DUF87 domain-containing protein [Gammaproteobacteria bacterium]